LKRGRDVSAGSEVEQVLGFRSFRKHAPSALRLLPCTIFPNDAGTSSAS
jgi:hypothetical protein